MLLDEKDNKLRHNTFLQEQVETPLAPRACFTVGVGIRRLEERLDGYFQFVLVHPLKGFPYT